MNVYNVERSTLNVYNSFHLKMFSHFTFIENGLWTMEPFMGLSHCWMHELKNSSFGFVCSIHSSIVVLMLLSVLVSCLNYL